MTSSKAVVHLVVFTSVKIEAMHFFSLTPFDLRYSRSQVVEDARLCVFGGHISKADCCSATILTSTWEEKVIAETDFREYGTVACLNGKFFSSFMQLRLT